MIYTLEQRTMLHLNQHTHRATHSYRTPLRHLLNPNISHHPPRRPERAQSKRSVDARRHCAAHRAQLTSALDTTRSPVARVERPAAAAATGLAMALVVTDLVLVRASRAGDTAAITPLTTW